MSTETLRALSRAYAAGNIDRESYRRARREMLRRVVAGEQALVAFHAPEPEMPTVFPYDENDGDTTQEIIPSIAAAAARRREPTEQRSPLIAIMVVVGVLAVTGYAVFQYTGSGDAPAPVGAVPVPPDSNVLDEFLAARTWTPASMSALRTAWDALPETSRSELVQSESASRLTAAVLQQIGAAEALLELGEAEDALETEGLLLDLVEHLGLDNARLGVARQRWQAALTAHNAATPAPATATATATAPNDAGDGAADTEKSQTTDATETPPASAEDTAVAEPVAGLQPPAPLPSAPPVVPDPSATAVLVEDSAEKQDDKPAPAVKPTTPRPAASAAVVPADTAATPAATAIAPATAARSNCRAALSKTRRPYCIDVAGDGTKGPLLVVLPAGRYTMGGREASEQPRHEVTLALPLAIGLFEVSAGEFALFCAATGATCPAQPWSKPAYPVVNVSWAQAEAYAKWLSRVLGADYRLPTEAEWEYAARGGSTSEYPLGDELLPTHARYSFKNKLNEPLPANDRSLNRNAFRLYHIIGNVREWVADAWAGTYAGAAADGSAHGGGGDHVVRGGSYADAADALRSAARLPLAAGDAQTGFRLVRQVD